MLRFHSQSIAAFGVTLVLTVATAIAAPAHAADGDAEVRTKAVTFHDIHLPKT